nr:hypothetical protein CFP56_32750 [Quercus suber]
MSIMPPRLRNSRQEVSQDNVHPAAQSHHSLATQDDQSEQPEVNQENSDHRFSFLLEMLQGMPPTTVESIRVLRKAPG